MKLLSAAPSGPLPSPAELLAVDEVMLAWCEAHGREELLHFWEPREPFVVVGYGNHVATEVNVPACAARGVPIHRRCSGGGTIVQLPGGLNYSLVLRIIPDGPTRSIAAANQYIMDRNRAALQSLAGPDALVSVRGHTDLCLGNRKFAGNSQRRQKNYLLFHGTLLLNCDLTCVGELLRMPSLQPDYRASRAHEEFITNFPASADSVKTALAEQWGVTGEAIALPAEEIARLAREKYATREWNFKF